MTDNEIIKALEKLYDEAHKGYVTHLEHNGPRDTSHEEYIDLMSATLALIQRQQEQIKALITGQETLQKHFAEEKKRIVEQLEAKAEDCRKYWDEFGDEDEISIMIGYKRAIDIVKGGAE